MSLQRKISRRNLKRMVGKSLPVLVEGPSEETDLLYQGRSERQAPGIDGCMLINDFEGPEPKRGEFRWATVTEVGDYDLVHDWRQRSLPSSRQPTIHCRR